MPTTRKSKYSLDEYEENRNKKNNDRLTQRKKDEKVENRTKILQVLYTAGPDGLSQKDLINETGLSDTAIQNHLEELIKEGLVTRKKHKQDHYRLTTEAAKSVELQSWLFGDEALRELRNGFTRFMNDMNYRIETKLLSMSLKPIIKTFGTPLTPEEYLNRFMREHERMNKISGSLSKTESDLFKFAMDVGVLVTYVMLKAIKPQSNNKTGKQKEYDSLLWAKNSVSSNSILFHFIQSSMIRHKKMLKESFAKKRIESMGERVDPIIKQDILDRLIPDELYSQYEVDERTYKDLEEAYKKIWPSSFLGLEFTMTNLYTMTVNTLKTVNNEDNLVTNKMIDQIRRNRELKEQNRMRNKNKD